ncbi:MAG: helix-turn-helix domain-containing protein [Actinomycetota bacterium]|nr:helix-turn-helix domain-containing protein [Actinomycetota bacterium]
MATLGLTTARYVNRLAGNLLRRARAEKDLTQRGLALAAGVPQSTVARIESGAQQPSLPLLARILVAVDLEPRIALAPYEAHDDVLDATEARLSPVEQETRTRTRNEFLAALKAGAQR